MKMFLLLFFLLSQFDLLADELKVEINPSRPVAGEVFQAYFRIFTSSDEEPLINFSPSNVEVVGKSNQGISTRTIYANGQLTVTREVTIVYDLVSSKSGTASLRDIRAQLGNLTLKHPLISFNILSEPQELGDVFVMADVSKKSLYLGEGVVVRYYLYSKVPVNNLDIKKYPKLDQFLKRFLQEPERTERVSVDGSIYMRTQIYAARLYPEKLGELKIDGLSLSATYPSSRSNDPFSAFGMGRDFKTKTMTSETIRIQVKPLPQPVPSHFTGLVGNHDFQFQIGKSKLLVNEPLEFKLTVSGVGALENLEGPELIKHSGLEEFETNGDLKITSAEQATKIFEYTYLAKENLDLPGKEVTLSYFDPNTNKYVPVSISIPEIVVAGGTQAPIAKSPEEKKSNTPKTHLAPAQSAPIELSSPGFNSVNSWKRWLFELNLAVFGLVAILVMIQLWGRKKLTFSFRSGAVPASFRKGDFIFSDFLKWLSPLVEKTGKSPAQIIKQSPLSEDSKRYFVELLSANDYKEFSARKTQMNFEYKAKYFKELASYIESYSNDRTSGTV